VAALLAALLAAGGCAGNAAPPNPAIAREAVTERGETVLEDQWAALLIAGGKVGYLHTVTRRIEGERPLIVTSIFSEVGIKRMGVNLSLSTFVEQRETPDGALVSASSDTRGGGTAVSVRMEVRDGQAIITTRTAGEPRTTTTPWDAEVLGPWAQTQRLRQSGFRPGARVEYKIFDPSLQRVIRSAVALDGPETLRIGGREMMLTRGVMTQDALPGVRTTVWLDERGDVVRSVTDAMLEIETLRATREEALSAVVPAEAMDVMDRFTIRTERIDAPERVRNALYRLTLPEEAFKSLALEDARQRIEGRGEGFVTLRVRADAQPAHTGRPPGPECLAASPYIQSDDADIRAAAREAAGEGTPQERARRIARWVHKAVHRKDYRVSFASAKEVLLSREGDCTEHAVLTAALLRAEGIPSRVTVGVAYWKESFAYHMWTEAYLGGWIPLDATLREDTVSATHIKLGATALETAAASDAFLGMVQVIGKLKIEVLSASTQDGG